MPVPPDNTRNSIPLVAPSATTCVFDVNRLKTHHLNPSDLAIVKQLDPRYFEPDFDPVPDLLNSIEIPTDFMQTTQERLNAQLEGIKHIDPTVLSLPPLPSFLAEMTETNDEDLRYILDDSIHVQGGLRSGGLDSLETALAHTNICHASISRVLESEMNRNKHKFIEGLLNAADLYNKITFALQRTDYSRQRIHFILSHHVLSSTSIVVKSRVLQRLTYIQNLLTFLQQQYSLRHQGQEALEKNNLPLYLEMLIYERSYDITSCNLVSFQCLQPWNVTSVLYHVEKSMDSFFDFVQDGLMVYIFDAADQPGTQLPTTIQKSLPKSPRCVASSSKQQQQQSTTQHHLGDGDDDDAELSISNEIWQSPIERIMGLLRCPFIIAGASATLNKYEQLKQQKFPYQAKSSSSSTTTTTTTATTTTAATASTATSSSSSFSSSLAPTSATSHPSSAATTNAVVPSTMMSIVPSAKLLLSTANLHQFGTNFDHLSGETSPTSHPNSRGGLTSVVSTSHSILNADHLLEHFTRMFFEFPVGIKRHVHQALAVKVLKHTLPHDELKLDDISINNPHSIAGLVRQLGARDASRLSQSLSTMYLRLTWFFYTFAYCIDVILAQMRYDLTVLHIERLCDVWDVLTAPPKNPSTTTTSSASSSSSSSTPAPITAQQQQSKSTLSPSAPATASSATASNKSPSPSPSIPYPTLTKIPKPFPAIRKLKRQAKQQQSSITAAAAAAASTQTAYISATTKIPLTSLHDTIMQAYRSTFCLNDVTNLLQDSKWYRHHISNLTSAREHFTQAHQILPQECLTHAGRDMLNGLIDCRALVVNTIETIAKDGIDILENIFTHCTKLTPNDIRLFSPLYFVHMTTLSRIIALSQQLPCSSVDFFSSHPTLTHESATSSISNHTSASLSSSATTSNNTTTTSTTTGDFFSTRYLAGCPPINAQLHIICLPLLDTFIIKSMQRFKASKTDAFNSISNLLLGDALIEMNINDLTRRVPELDQLLDIQFQREISHSAHISSSDMLTPTSHPFDIDCDVTFIALYSFFLSVIDESKHIPYRNILVNIYRLESWPSHRSEEITPPHQFLLSYYQIEQYHRFFTQLYDSLTYSTPIIFLFNDAPFRHYLDSIEPFSYEAIRDDSFSTRRISHYSKFDYSSMPLRNIPFLAAPVTAADAAIDSSHDLSSYLGDDDDDDDDNDGNKSSARPPTITLQCLWQSLRHRARHGFSNVPSSHSLFSFLYNAKTCRPCPEETAFITPTPSSSQPSQQLARDDDDNDDNDDLHITSLHHSLHSPDHLVKQFSSLTQCHHEPSLTSSSISVFRSLCCVLLNALSFSPFQDFFARLFFDLTKMYTYCLTTSLLHSITYTIDTTNLFDYKLNKYQSQRAQNQQRTALQQLYNSNAENDGYDDWDSDDEYPIIVPEVVTPSLYATMPTASSPSTSIPSSTPLSAPFPSSTTHQSTIPHSSYMLHADQQPSTHERHSFAARRSSVSHGTPLQTGIPSDYIPIIRRHVFDKAKPFPQLALRASDQYNFVGPIFPEISTDKSIFLPPSILSAYALPTWVQYPHLHRLFRVVLAELDSGVYGADFADNIHTISSEIMQNQPADDHFKATNSSAQSTSQQHISTPYLPAQLPAIPTPIITQLPHQPLAPLTTAAATTIPESATTTPSTSVPSTPSKPPAPHSLNSTDNAAITPDHNLTAFADAHEEHSTTGSSATVSRWKQWRQKFTGTDATAAAAPTASSTTALPPAPTPTVSGVGTAPLASSLPSSESSLSNVLTATAAAAHASLNPSHLLPRQPSETQVTRAAAPTSSGLSIFGHSRVKTGIMLDAVHMAVTPHTDGTVSSVRDPLVWTQLSSLLHLNDVEDLFGIGLKLTACISLLQLSVLCDMLGHLVVLPQSSNITAEVMDGCNHQLELSTKLDLHQATLQQIYMSSQLLQKTSIDLAMFMIIQSCVQAVQTLEIDNKVKSTYWNVKQMATTPSPYVEQLQQAFTSWFSTLQQNGTICSCFFIPISAALSYALSRELLHSLCYVKSASDEGKLLLSLNIRVLTDHVAKLSHFQRMPFSNIVFESVTALYYDTDQFIDWVKKNALTLRLRKDHLHGLLQANNNNINVNKVKQAIDMLYEDLSMRQQSVKTTMAILRKQKMSHLLEQQSLYSDNSRPNSMRRSTHNDHDSDDEFRHSRRSTAQPSNVAAAGGPQRGLFGLNAVQNAQPYGNFRRYVHRIEQFHHHYFINPPVIDIDTLTAQHVHPASVLLELDESSDDELSHDASPNGTSAATAIAAAAAEMGNPAHKPSKQIKLVNGDDGDDDDGFLPISIDFDQDGLVPIHNGILSPRRRSEKKQQDNEPSITSNNGSGVALSQTITDEQDDNDDDDDDDDDDFDEDDGDSTRGTVLRHIAISAPSQEELSAALVNPALTSGLNRSAPPSRHSSNPSNSSSISAAALGLGLGLDPFTMDAPGRGAQSRRQTQLRPSTSQQQKNKANQDEAEIMDADSFFSE